MKVSRLVAPDIPTSEPNKKFFENVRAASLARCFTKPPFYVDQHAPKRGKARLSVRAL